MSCVGRPLNSLIHWGGLFGLLLTLLIVYTPQVSALSGFVPLSRTLLTASLLVAIAYMVATEFTKWRLFRRAGGAGTGRI